MSQSVHKIRKSIISILLGLIFAFGIYNVSFMMLSNTYAKDKKPITIKCTGDSVTEGVGLPDEYTATINGATYPSVLYTMLKNKGINAVVENAGHSAEKTSAIIARLGTVPLYLNEDVVFDSEGCSGVIDEKITAKFNLDFQVPISIKFTETDVNPVVINGKHYKAKMRKVENKWKSFLYKEAGDTTTSIAAGTEIQFSGTRRNDINIIFAGINDKEDISIDKYVEMLKAGSLANAGKYIIIGPHNKMYCRSNFVSGNSVEEKHEQYKLRMTKEFGDHFIDLNSEWYKRALQIALDNGYFSNYSDEQLQIIKVKLDNGIIPAEFTNNNVEGNVHLNKIGNTVIAQIVYERLLQLGYINN